MRSIGRSAGASHVPGGTRERVSGFAQAEKARIIDALVEARPLLGRKHSGEGENEEE